MVGWRFEMKQMLMAGKMKRQAGCCCSLENSVEEYFLPEMLKALVICLEKIIIEKYKINLNC